MIDSHHIYPDVLSLRPLDALDILQRQAQKLLVPNTSWQQPKALILGNTRYSVFTHTVMGLV